jgi:hypothetical protein
MNCACPQVDGRYARTMDLPDADLVRRLEARDGSLGRLARPHSAAGVCRYKEQYERDCPWCEAEARRVERESQGDR